MVAAAVWILTIAVVAGTGLGFWHLRPHSRPPLAAGVAHGMTGTIGLVTLLLALRGPVRGVETGVGSFGTMSAALFAGALITGTALLLLHRRRSVMAIHAAIAITGYAIVLAWASLG